MTEGPEALLDGLDEQQRLAATTLRGPVCVLAGAGTGKTRAITHRIAYGVATGVYPPKRVLALTFTTRAASELRARLRALGADGVSARTFHAAALAQLNHFWPQVLNSQVPKLLESKSALIAQAAEVMRLRLEPAAVRDLAAEVEYRKVSGLGFEEYAAGGHQRPMPSGLDVDAVVRLQQLYERLKEERRLLDFEDVLLATTGMIESEPRVALEVREQYRYFVVDEYQDVSPIQQELLNAWLGDGREVCVVGDASQTIYSFAGARADYLLRFADRYADAAVLRLERNYRSAPPVLDAANSLMAGRPGAFTLRPAGRDDPHDASCSARRYVTDAEEAAGVAAEIANLLAAGTAPDSVAVLYRFNSQAAALETALTSAGVPVATRGARRYFEQPVVREAVMLLRGASVAEQTRPLFQTVSDVLREVGYTHRPPQGPGEQRTRWELLDALATLSEQTPPGTTLAAFVADLAERAAAQHEPTLKAVTLATLHSAKGLEWPVVFLIGLAEGLLPIGYATTPDAIEEERRLLYVGVTRARERLRLSWAATGSRERSSERMPSRFLADLGLDPASSTSSARARAPRAG